MISEGLDGSVAVVTGAGRGIGRAIAEELSRRGAAVAALDLSAGSAQETADLLDRSGGRALGIGCDVGVRAEAFAAVARVERELGEVAVLVNNAGVSPRRDGGRIPVEEITEAEWDALMAVNLKGPLFLAQAVAAGMKRQGRGCIVNITSITAKTGSGDGAAGAHYAISKAGLVCLTKSLARELAPFGVRACGVSPGLVNTAMRASASPEVNQKLVSRIPLGRLAEPAEIAAVVAFLASGAASYLTGEIIDADGGMMMD